MLTMLIADKGQDPNKVFRICQLNRSYEVHGFCLKYFYEIYFNQVRLRSEVMFISLEVLTSRKHTGYAIISHCSITISDCDIIF